MITTTVLLLVVSVLRRVVCEFDRPLAAFCQELFKLREFREQSYDFVA